MINYNTIYTLITTIKSNISKQVNLNEIYQKDKEMQRISVGHYQNLILSKAIFMNKSTFFEELGQLCQLLNNTEIIYEIADLQPAFEQQLLFQEFYYITWAQFFEHISMYNEIESDAFVKLSKYFVIYPDRLISAEIEIRLKFIKNEIAEHKKNIYLFQIQGNTEKELQCTNLLIKANNRIKRLEQSDIKYQMLI